MSRKTRSENFALACHLNYGVTNAAKKLAGLTNHNYVSKMAAGEREISDFDARQIEKVLALPEGWMDRQNLAMLNMGKADFDIYSNISSVPDVAKAGLLAFLTSSREGACTKLG